VHLVWLYDIFTKDFLFSFTFVKKQGQRTSVAEPHILINAVHASGNQHCCGYGFSSNTPTISLPHQTFDISHQLKSVLSTVVLSAGTAKSRIALSGAGAPIKCINVY
jgi:hypothetical protein